MQTHWPKPTKTVIVGKFAGKILKKISGRSSFLEEKRGFGKGILGNLLRARNFRLPPLTHRRRLRP
jgi:hypothetical protein